MGMDDFFAAVDKDSIAGELSDRVEDWHRLMKVQSNFERMQKSYRTYYGLTKSGLNSSSQVRTAGERDELALVNVNLYRSLLQSLLVMTCQQRPAMECRASNTDRLSQEQCILGNGILDYYVREKKLEGFLRSATEIALVYSEGYLGLEWDPSLGNVYSFDPVSQRPIFEGDIEYKTYTPFDMIRDLTAKSASEESWKMAVTYKNKYNLAAKYPELADQIVRIEEGKLMNLRQELMNRSLVESDLIPVYKFYHDRSEALPQGRMVMFLDSDLKLLDTPLPYKRIPVSRIAPNDQIDTPFGYTVGFDLLGLQDVYNSLFSISYTNQKTFGVQNILVPEGHNMNPVQLFGGLNLLKYNNKMGEIKPLQLTSTPAEVFSNMDRVKAVLTELSGQNSVTRGQPDQNIKSGSFAALVAAQAIQFNSGLQNSFNMLLEDTGMQTIEMLQTFAETERVVNIVGKNNASMTESFTAKNLKNITRVVVDAQNPLLKTTEGKMEMANQLLQAGKIESPEQYIMVATTGKIEPLYEGQQKELLLIRDENEQMQDGEKPTAIAVDNHALHIKEHKCVLSDRVMRKEGNIAQAVLAHIQEHIDLLRNTDPGLLAVLGEQPLPPVQPPMPQGPQGMPPPDAAPVPKAPGLESTQVPPPSVMPSQPRMPSNPLTGNKYNPVTGGM